MRSLKYVCIVSFILLSVLSLASWEVASLYAQTGLWTKPVNISQTSNASWFPDLAVDSAGNVHGIWCETTPLKGGGDKEQAYYSMWDGQTWSTPNDIVPPQVDIIRSAIAVDAYDTLHLVFGWHKMYYKRARASEAQSAAAWTSPYLVNDRLHTYMKDIAVYEDTLHIVYDDMGVQDEDVECPGCADIYYRRSTDRGLTWSMPVALFPTGTGSNYAQMEVDKAGVVYVAWNEGWDRFVGGWDPRYGVYMYSADGGSTWSAPTIVWYPNATNMRLAVGSNGQGGVMLVWRTASQEYPGIYYMWSTDYGESWAPPQALPNIFAQTSISNHGMYDMATDSGGHIHLVVVGRPSLEEDGLGVYHLEWDGTSWSPPTAIYRGAGFPDYPNIVISEGNKLHVAWYVRETLEGGNNEIWYSSSQAASPAQTPVPLPTSTPTLTPTPLATATPTATPYPTLAPGSSTALPDGLYTESDDLFRLLIGLAPVLILVTAIVVIRLGWLRRSSGR
jgi:hypothetical protein